MPALRVGGPARIAYGHGSPPDLSTPELRNRALADLEAGTYSASNTVQARRASIARLLAPWSVHLFPATPASLKMLGAALKAGHYRSAATTLSQYKVDCERAGQAFDSSLLRVYTDVARSFRRGLGPCAPGEAVAFRTPG